MSTSIWSGLTPTKQVRAPAERLEPKADSTKGPLGKAREMLRVRGPLTARQITDSLGLQKSSSVGAMLQNERRKGRIEYRDGMYHYNHDFDVEKAEELARAAEMLRRHGYEVKKQGAKA